MLPAHALKAAASFTLTAAMAACGGSPGAQMAGGMVNTDSPIAGSTLRCAGDYADSRLVFGRDGTLGGRYAGQDVTGSWNALSPDTVEVLLHAGAIAVQDTIRRT